MTTDFAIEATGLEKTFGTTRALAGLDLAARRGSILGLLGPNGAGKTTAIRILTTLTRPDAGRAIVAGFDVATHAAQVRYRIGLAGQYAALDESLTGMANLVMVGQLGRLSHRAARARATDLLERFDLVAAARRAVKTYSGGMRRRLDLAASLVTEPEVIFLDEPTTGLDPQNRLVMWDVIRSLAGRGATVLLTTQYLEEADQLADRILVVDHGLAIAEGTADELKQRVGGARTAVTVADERALDLAGKALGRFATGDVHFDREARRVDAAVDNGSQRIAEIVRELDAAAVAIEDIGIRRPSLDDVFLELTGRPVEEDAREQEGATR